VEQYRAHIKSLDADLAEANDRAKRTSANVKAYLENALQKPVDAAALARIESGDWPEDVAQFASRRAAAEETSRAHVEKQRATPRRSASKDGAELTTSGPAARGFSRDTASTTTPRKLQVATTSPSVSGEREKEQTPRSCTDRTEPKKETESITPKTPKVATAPATPISVSQLRAVFEVQ
jgi:hypothetical protein